MAKMLTPLNQAALKAEEFCKAEKEIRKTQADYDRGLKQNLKKAFSENKMALICLIILCIILVRIRTIWM